MKIEYLTIKLKCLNAAFDDNEGRDEIGRILHFLGQSILSGDDQEIFRDINGNRVASIEYQYESES